MSLTTELPLSVYKKLLEVKKKIPYLQKDKKSFNYSYASPSAVFGQLNPILNEVGLILVTNVIDSKSYELTPKLDKEGKPKAADWKFDLNFIFDWVCVQTGEKLSIPWSASGCNGEDKGLGSALTYAERYFVLKQFNIPTDSDDPDSFQDKHMTAEEKKAAEKKVAEEKKAAEKEAADILEVNKKTLTAATDFATLAAAWVALPDNVKPALLAYKDKLKSEFAMPKQVTQSDIAPPITPA